MSEAPVAVTTDGPITAHDIGQLLLGRWTAGEYVVIPEAPDGVMRMGRKLDYLVCSCWASRGFELDGVEVKVSYSDWKRERDNPAKADWWYGRVHRFWLAAPAVLAERILPELPVGWGLLACYADSTREIAKPQRHAAEPLEWGTVLGLLRAASGAGMNALSHAHETGRSQGWLEGKHQAECESGDAFLREKLTRLQAAVDRFEEGTGTKLETYSAEHLARIAVLASCDPVRMVDSLGYADRGLQGARVALDEAITRLRALADNPPLSTDSQTRREDQA
jgi:hypothetical protein